MKDLGIFLIGLVTGLAAGGVGAYFYSKKKCDEMIDREIEAYAEYTEAKIEHMKTLIAEGSVDEPEREDEEVVNNEGVKKYHHQEEGISSLMERKPFGKVETKAEEENKVFEVEGIEEITEAEFLKTYADPDFGPYDKVTLDLLWDPYPEDEDTWQDNSLFWGYGTDNECLAMTMDKYKSCSITDILGEMWRWCNDYIDEDQGFGSFYVRNHNLHQDIECVVREVS